MSHLPGERAVYVVDRDINNRLFLSTVKLGEKNNGLMQTEICFVVFPKQNIKRKVSGI